MEFEWYKRFEVALVLQTQRYTRIELKLKVSQLFLSTPKHFFRAKKWVVLSVFRQCKPFRGIRISRTCLI